jgi:amino acid adenylation domain-containing protein
MMVCILGILKAGGAYLPVDMAYPADRISYMLANAEVALLLTQTHLLENLPDTAARRICLETLEPLLGQHDAGTAQLDNPDTVMGVDNLLYVLYTSGSTGQPKGVAMPHRPLSNLIQWHLRQDWPAAARTLQLSPISFDVSCQEMFATWCAGGTLVLVPESTRRDAYALLRYLAEQRIERLFLPFVALQQLAEAAVNQADWRLVLRDVITAGEQLQITPAIAAWFRRIDARLHNHYGPSETHVITAYTLPDSVDLWPPLPSIGRPLANCQVYVLDRFRQPVPVGVAGELYLGGAGVAKGYLNQAELTQERFYANPWQAGRLYRSGDLGRYRSDGHIDYLGRADSQVKVRGYRIEPGEIEGVLAQHPTVKEAVVLAPVDPQGHRQLVAYVIPGDEVGHADPRPVWRKHLQEILPAYMLPSHFVPMPEFPLTPSGKVDRRKLLSQGAIHAPTVESMVSPRTGIERAIAAVWRELLGINDLGLHDNFFDVGGHSLLVVQMHDKLQQSLNMALSITDLFQYPSIASLAEYLGNTEKDEPGHQENRARAQARRRSLGRRTSNHS